LASGRHAVDVGFARIGFGPASHGERRGTTIVKDGQTALFAGAIGVDATQCSSARGITVAISPDAFAYAGFIGSAIRITGARIMTAAKTAYLTICRDAFAVRMRGAISVGPATEILFISRASGHVNRGITRR
jgi:hypothetical protein